MCEQTQYKTSNSQIDKCIREEIKEFNKAIKLIEGYLLEPITIVASCCGHGKYPKTLVIRTRDRSSEEPPFYHEHFSGEHIMRTRNFYRKDAQGVYHIPEVKNETSERHSDY